MAKGFFTRGGKHRPVTAKKNRHTTVRYAPREAARRRSRAASSPKLHKQLIEERDGAKIYSVDGAYVRNNIDSDFTQGSHYVVDKWVPEGEIWVDQDIPDRKPLVEHEVYEVKRMKQGESYTVAHKKSLKREEQFRKPDPNL